MKELEAYSDLEAHVLDKLMPHKKILPVLTSIVKSFVPQLAELEQVFLDLYLLRRLDNATDEALDVIGRIVGESRLGKTDENYETAIRGKIRANRSNGRIEDVYDALTIALPLSTWECDDYPNKTVVLRLKNVGSSLEELWAILSRAKEAGSRYWLQYGESTDLNTFSFSSSDLEENIPFSGYGEDDESSGGYYSDVVR